MSHSPHSSASPEASASSEAAAPEAVPSQGSGSAGHAPAAPAPTASAPAPSPVGVKAWLAERLAGGGPLRDLLHTPVVGGPSPLRAVGGAWVATFLVLAITGVLLSTVYAPSVNTAWASVRYVQFVLPGGWLVRGVHHFASHALVVLSVLWMVAKALRHAHRRPYEVAWWLGLLTLPLVLGLAITGHALPWDQFGWWARRVEINITQMAPGGSAIAAALLGGPDIGSVALARFHALHVVVLPALLVMVVWLERSLVKKLDASPVMASAPREPYFPRQAALDVGAGLVALGVVMGLAARSHGAPLDAPADPQSDYPARPEWFLLAMYQLRHYFKGSMEVYGTSALPAFLGAWLALLPLVDRRPGGPARRVAFLAPLLFGLGAWGLLSNLARSADASDEKAQKAFASAAQARDEALRIAEKGVPPQGPLWMLAHDPERRGKALYGQHCAACHVLGDQGDRTKISGPVLDGWSTEKWLVRVQHEPDHDELFGKTPFKGNMPSMDVPPKDAEGFVALKPDEMDAIAHFLFAEGLEKGDEASIDAAKRKRGEDRFKAACTTCHLYKKDGDLGDNGFAPELAAYASIGWVRAQIANPATPTTYRDKALSESLKGHMPRFDGELSPSDLDLLARWVRAKARGLPLAE